jgi:hypothetical protein
MQEKKRFDFNYGKIRALNRSGMVLKLQPLAENKCFNSNTSKKYYE